ncbi:hypothetical protein [Leeuwenhoekiella marinoflava]|uniref:DUF998 domain-containing protein n=2 Tax=Leeuwenhoekiella marinoflava TaxID=988 RepID=A0A4V1KSQ9_9FLAO|nr:hypothetical protein [Leeuwenhoekiella marinoflava]RXG32598.1 hypothetical protein DSL99_922 [Leeuwenhoekiella marinoflava]SHE65863.1 hypothetical protein SAMN02745246_00754 [Leeuwenhoekiella marinoflava DSM 3653]
MKDQKSQTLSESLNLNYASDNGVWLHQGKTLRKIVGTAGMLLPVLLLASSLTVFEMTGPLESISHYYYTRAATLFTVTVSLIGIFLIVYSGEEPVDFWVSNIAGIAALCVAFFPTNNLAESCCDATMPYAVTYFDESQEGWRSTFHYISAAVFLVSLAFMALFLFVKSNTPKEKRCEEKVRRNKVYRICGIVMIVALVVIILGLTEIISPETYNRLKLTFWMEALAVEAFGFSWLVKGEAIMGDQPKVKN